MSDPGTRVVSDPGTRVVSDPGTREVSDPGTREDVLQDYVQMAKLQFLEITV